MFYVKQNANNEIIELIKYYQKSKRKKVDSLEEFIKNFQEDKVIKKLLLVLVTILVMGCNTDALKPNVEQKKQTSSKMKTDYYF